jgi:predicted phosphoadenosine phosphosulfate sulfurtransferase
VSKIYLLQNVYEAAIERLLFVRENFDRVVVAVSGGKDSTTVLNLALEVFGDLIVYFWDKESNLLSTMRFLRETVDALPSGVRPYWFCYKYRMRNALSVFEPWWYAWDPEARARWIYQPPDRDYVYTNERNILVPYGYDPDKHNLYRLFGEHVSERGKYRTAVLVGLRADESLNRFRAVSKHPQMGKTWMTLTDAGGDNVYNAYPIYDWSFGDVWTYLSRNDIPYNPIYDKMHWAGMDKREMRISQGFCDVAKRGLPIIRRLEPESYRRFLQRVVGVNSLAHIDLDELKDLAEDVDFETLMTLYPPDVREFVEAKLERSPTLNGDDEAVIRALLNGDIRLKRVNRDALKKAERGAAIKKKYEDL